MPVIDKTQIGLKREATWGTRVAPDKFFEFSSEGLTLDQRFHLSQQLGSGAMAPRGSRRKKTTRSGGGPVVMEVPNKGYGSILDLMHDNVVTPVQQGATTAWLQTHNIGLTAPSTKFATIQVNRPDAGNTDRPFDYLGCIISEVTWSIDVDGALVATHTFDAQDEKTDQSLAVRSLPTALESFVFTEGTFSIAGGAVADVTDVSITVPFGRDEFYGLGTSGLKSKPQQNAVTVATGTATARFTDLTHYNRYKNNTQPALELKFETATLAGTAIPFKFELDCAQVGFTGETPTVGGPDVITHGIPFEVYYDGTNAPLVVQYISTDTAL